MEEWIVGVWVWRYWERKEEIHERRIKKRKVDSDGKKVRTNQVFPNGLIVK